MCDPQIINPDRETSIMSFLPQNYEVPQSGLYMKFTPGKNRFRVLGPAVIGNEFWRSKGDGREPVRRRMNETIAANELEINPKDGTPEKVKHFWAFPVWNYAAKAVQVLEVTQKSIMGSIQSLVTEEDWGDPMGYDIILSKSGSGLETEYAVQPAPAKPIDPAIAAAFAATPLNLEALFDGGDPFATSNGSKPEKSNNMPQEASPAQAAMRKAQIAFKGKYPSSPKEELIEGWKLVTKKYFNGKDIGLVTSVEWEKFAADGFEKPKAADPFGGEQTFQVDDPNHPDFIPF
jgi:hypothetical protein